jgi:hypothetical protein
MRCKIEGMPENDTPKLTFDDVGPLEDGDKWLGRRCPDGRRQELAILTGHRERNQGELELRVLLCECQSGVCDVVLEETNYYVRVRAFTCGAGDQTLSRSRRIYTDCPCRIWLSAPLGNRPVIEWDTSEPLPVVDPWAFLREREDA